MHHLYNFVFKPLFLHCIFLWHCCRRVISEVDLLVELTKVILSFVMLKLKQALGTLYFIVSMLCYMYLP